MKITDIDDGQVVPGPGAYRMSMQHYHSQACCPGPSISSSGLRKIWGESPFHFWMVSDLNPDRLPPREESSALALGKAAHALMLGEENFDAMFAYVPEDAPRRPNATQIKAFERDGVWSDAAAPGAAFWEAWDAEHAGKTVITFDMVERIRRMSQSLHANPLAVEVLTGALTEVSLIWQDEATGVWLKSRVDVIPNNGADFTDLKTWSPRGKNVKRAIYRAISEHEYPMQLAMAQIASQKVFGINAETALLVMLMSVEPYCCTVVEVDAEALRLSRLKIRSAIDTFAHCMKEGHWPQPVEGVLKYTMAESEIERLSEMAAVGDFPNEP